MQRVALNEVLVTQWEGLQRCLRRSAYELHWLGTVGLYKKCHLITIEALSTFESHFMYAYRCWLMWLHMNCCKGSWIYLFWLDLSLGGVVLGTNGDGGWWMFLAPITPRNIILAHRNMLLWYYVYYTL